MKSPGKRRQQNAHPIRSSFGRTLRRIFPVFRFGWMLLYSMLFACIIFLAMLGVDRICSTLISSTGYIALTSANFRMILRSWQGPVALVILLVSLTVVAAVIMNGVIFLSDDMLHHRKIRLFPLLKRSVLSIRLFLCREGIPVILYYFVFVLFFAVSLLSVVPNPFEIPGYLRYQVSKTLISLLLYFVFFVLISIPLLRNPLLLHDVLLRQESPRSARLRTRVFAHDHRRFLFREMLQSFLFFCLVLLAGTVVFLYFPLLIQTLFFFLPPPARRILVLLSTYLALAVLAITVLLAVWILPLKIAMLYHFMIHKALPARHARGRIRRPLLFLLAALFTCVLAGAVTVSFLHFNYLYPPARNIEAVVHRLGGDLDTENTIEGMEKAIELGAPALETDIQRTKDGAYVIFHDSTLQRLCGIPSRINEMTLEQVRAVTLPSPDWEERHIPLLSEVLDRAKGRARLYLELKGTDADQKMAMDVANMVRARDMEDECVLISMNYNLISYISRRIPDIRSGYLYFFAYGSSSSLAGNILMAQSNAISIRKTRAIHAKGKKVYCWTVNSRQTALNMVRQHVDGIISDRYDIIASVLNHMESRNDYERIMDVLLR